MNDRILKLYKRYLNTAVYRCAVCHWQSEDMSLMVVRKYRKGYKVYRLESHVGLYANLLHIRSRRVMQKPVTTPNVHRRYSNAGTTDPSPCHLQMPTVSLQLDRKRHPRHRSNGTLNSDLPLLVFHSI
jgi:hypothetical protein